MDANKHSVSLKDKLLRNYHNFIARIKSAIRKSSSYDNEYGKTYKEKTNLTAKFALILAILSLTITLLNNPMIVFILQPNVEAVYTSDVFFDYLHGANYTSIRWEYTIQPSKTWFVQQNVEGWATLDMDIRNIQTNFDLSQYEGVSFYIQGSVEGQPVEFNLFTHETLNGENLLYQYWNNASLILPGNWRRVDIYFSNLTLTPWSHGLYARAPLIPELEKVNGFGFAVKSSETTSNVVWLDDVYLFKSNGEKTLVTSFENSNVTINGVDGVWCPYKGHH